MTRSRLRRQPTPAPPIKAIIFDIGRVIVGLDPRRIISILGRSPSKRMSASPDMAWATIQKDPLWLDWQEGRLSPREWSNHLIKLFKVNITFKQFCDAWNSVILPDTILPGHLFARLSKKCRLVLLSNTDPLHVDFLESRYTYYRYFPARIYSCGLGVSKPNPRIFQAAIHAAGVPPRNILYVDDVLEYVRAGRRQGLQAHQFRSRPLLEASLRSHGLL